jgi:hypothetical protein
VTTQVVPEAAEQGSGGAAAGDFDGDGWVDLAVSRGDAPPILFRNNGDGTFADVTTQAGELAETLPAGSNGVAWGDIDNDGDLDLYVTSMNTRRFHLFINEWPAGFREEAVERGAAIASDNLHYGTGIAFGDYDRDGYVDLFAAEWRAHPLPPASPIPGPSHNRLLRNLGPLAPGSFADVTAVAGIDVDDVDVATNVLGDPGYSPGFADFDDDGWPDVLWVADWGQSRLFWNNSDGTFIDGTGAAGVGLERSGMGSTQDDFNGDGSLDWFTTSIFGRQTEIRFGVSNQLYLNDGQRNFTNVTEAAGVADGGFGWAASGFDFDNDGDVDIVTTNGFIAPGHPEEERWATDQTRLFENQGEARFVDVAAGAGITDVAQGKGLLTFDYDRDGDLDVFIVNHADQPVLYRNDPDPQNAWIQLELVGTVSNRDGIGAVITIDPDAAKAGDSQTQRLLDNSNFLGHDELIAHFGLGAVAEPIDRITIKWPSGIEQVIEEVALRQRLRVVEPATSLRFVDVTAAAGFTYQHGYSESLVSPDGSFDESRHIAGGVAAGDYDNDGWTDLYVVRGDIGPNLLFRNRGDGTFEEVGEAAGVAIAGAAGSGPAFADVDGDGWLDLLVGGVRGTPVALFRNSGDGCFEDVTAASGLATGADTYSAAFGDFDLDGDLDLALAHWNRFVSYDESSQTLWRNEGGFRFVDVSLAAGITAALLRGRDSGFEYTFAPNFADIDTDGWPDLLIAGDFSTSTVLVNRRDGTFADATDRDVITDENGMGPAVGDYDNDGHLDWFVSSVWDPDGVAEENWRVSGNRLYRGRGDGTFEDVTSAAGVRQGFWGWGATFADVDNDGHLDLFHVNGFGRSPTYEPTLAFYADPTRLYLANGDGTFTEQAKPAGIDDTGMGRGVVSFDADRDGDLDLFIANSEQSPRFYRNNGQALGHFLGVRLRGPRANSEGIGARVYLRTGESTQMREIRAGSNFESQDPAEAHFGIGAATHIDELLVVWPGGTSQRLADLAADQRLVVTAPDALPTPTAGLTPTAVPTCIGDCDGSGGVTVDEIVRAISIALGLLAADVCTAVDGNGDGGVTVDEVLAAVAAVLNGCLAAS